MDTQDGGQVAAATATLSALESDCLLAFSIALYVRSRFQGLLRLIFLFIAACTSVAVAACWRIVGSTTVRAKT